MLLALDMSTKSTGYSIFDNDKLICSGCLTASSTDTIKRIRKIMSELQPILEQYNITEVVAEEVLPDKETGETKNLRTQKVLMWMQGALEFLIYDFNSKIKIEYVYPSTWRKSCGIKNGKGIKRDTLKPKDIQFVKETFNLDVNDDEADAICIGYYATHKPKEINWE